MPQESERPRPHGDPLEDEIVDPEGAEREPDAPPDPVRSDVVDGVPEFEPPAAPRR
jgi:hypothetical protein